MVGKDIYQGNLKIKQYKKTRETDPIKREGSIRPLKAVKEYTHERTLYRH